MIYTSKGVRDGRGRRAAAAKAAVAAEIANIVVSWSRIGPKKEQFSTVSTHTHIGPTDRATERPSDTGGYV